MSTGMWNKRIFWFDDNNIKQINHKEKAWKLYISSLPLSTTALRSGVQQDKCSINEKWNNNIIGLLQSLSLLIVISLYLINYSQK